jgi:hypothetical protein
VWRAIEWSTQQKDIRYFSMAAAHLFLQRFGGQRHATYRYSLDRSPFRVHDLAKMGLVPRPRRYNPQRRRPMTVLRVS